MPFRTISQLMLTLTKEFVVSPQTKSKGYTEAFARLMQVSSTSPTDKEIVIDCLSKVADICREFAGICDELQDSLKRPKSFDKRYVQYVTKHYLRPNQLLRKDTANSRQRVACYCSLYGREKWRKEIHERITDYMECQEAIRNQRLFPMTPKGFHEYIHHNSHAYACTHSYGSRCDKLKPNRVFYGEKRKRRHIEYAD